MGIQILSYYKSGHPTDVHGTRSQGFFTTIILDPLFLSVSRSLPSSYDYSSMLIAFNCNAFRKMQSVKPTFPLYTLTGLTIKTEQQPPFAFFLIWGEA